MIQKLIQTITRRIPEEHIAIGHDWLVSARGGEKILQAIAQCFPKATIYTLFYDKEIATALGIRNPVKVSFLGKLPFVRYYYRYLFFLYPWAIRALSPPNAKLILTTSHTLIKNLRSRAPHISITYIFAPLRYLYARKKDYLDISRFYRWTEPLIRPLLQMIKRWDKQNHPHINKYLTISKFIAQQVKEVYDQDAEVIYPFYNNQLFKLPQSPLPIPERKYFLLLGALVPYKLPNIVLEAFAHRLPYQLKVVGTGPMFHKLQKKYSQATNIKFEGFVPDSELPQLYQNAKALIFPGIEDFGIVPLEAAACGCPVIAYPHGGIVESLREHFWPISEQTPHGIYEAITAFLHSEHDIVALTNAVKDFTTENFQKRFLLIVSKTLTTSRTSTNDISMYEPF